MKTNELVKSNDLSALERVWERQNEAKQTYIDKDTFAEVERLNPKKIASIAKEEGTTLDDFIKYAQVRSLQKYSERKTNE